MYIAIEGIDGSGKSTFIKTIDEDFYRTREPLIHYPLNWPIVTELLFAVDRFYKEYLLKRKDNVISDRSVISGIVYSKLRDDNASDSIAQKINAKITKFSITHSTFPDEVLFIDTPPHICKKGVKDFTHKQLKELRKLYITTLRQSGYSEVHEFSTGPGDRKVIVFQKITRRRTIDKKTIHNNK